MQDLWPESVPNARSRYLLICIVDHAAAAKGAFAGIFLIGPPILHRRLLARAHMHLDVKKSPSESDFRLLKFT